MGNSSKKPQDYQMISSYNYRHWTIKQQLTYCQIWQNSTLNLSAEAYEVPLNTDSIELDKYSFRSQNNKDIVGVYHIVIDQNQYLCSRGDKMHVLTQRIPIRLDNVNQLSMAQALSVLVGTYSGYITIGSYYGPVMPDSQCIGFTQSGKTKVWVNPNLALNIPLKQQKIAQSQQLEKRNKQYVKDIFQMVEKRTIGGLPRLKTIIYNKQPTYFEALNIVENYAEISNIRIPQTIRPRHLDSFADLGDGNKGKSSVVIDFGQRSVINKLHSPQPGIQQNNHLYHSISPQPILINNQQPISRFQQPIYSPNQITKSRVYPLQRQPQTLTRVQSHRSLSQYPINNNRVIGQVVNSPNQIYKQYPIPIRQQVVRHQQIPSIQITTNKPKRHVFQGAPLSNSSHRGQSNIIFQQITPSPIMKPLENIEVKDQTNQNKNQQIHNKILSNQNKQIQVKNSPLNNIPKIQQNHNQQIVTISKHQEQHIQPQTYYSKYRHKGYGQQQQNKDNQQKQDMRRRQKQRQDRDKDRQRRQRERQQKQRQRQQIQEKQKRQKQRQQRFRRLRQQRQQKQQQKPKYQEKQAYQRQFIHRTRRQQRSPRSPRSRQEITYSVSNRKKSPTKRQTDEQQPINKINRASSNYVYRTDNFTRQLQNQNNHQQQQEHQPYFSQKIQQKQQSPIKRQYRRQTTGQKVQFQKDIENGLGGSQRILKTKKSDPQDFRDWKSRQQNPREKIQQVLSYIRPKIQQKLKNQYSPKSQHSRSNYELESSQLQRQRIKLQRQRKQLQQLRQQKKRFWDGQAQEVYGQRSQRLKMEKSKAQERRIQQQSRFKQQEQAQVQWEKQKRQRQEQRKKDRQNRQKKWKQQYQQSRQQDHIDYMQQNQQPNQQPFTTIPYQPIGNQEERVQDYEEDLPVRSPILQQITSYTTTYMEAPNNLSSSSARKNQKQEQNHQNVDHQHSTPTLTPAHVSPYVSSPTKYSRTRYNEKQISNPTPVIPQTYQYDDIQAYIRNKYKLKGIDQAQPQSYTSKYNRKQQKYENKQPQTNKYTRKEYTYQNKQPQSNQYSYKQYKYQTNNNNLKQSDSYNIADQQLGRHNLLTFMPKDRQKDILYVQKIANRNQQKNNQPTIQQDSFNVADMEKNLVRFQQSRVKNSLVSSQAKQPKSNIKETQIQINNQYDIKKPSRYQRSKYQKKYDQTPINYEATYQTTDPNGTKIINTTKYSYQRKTNRNYDKPIDYPKTNTIDQKYQKYIQKKQNIRNTRNKNKQPLDANKNDNQDKYQKYINSKITKTYKSGYLDKQTDQKFDQESNSGKGTGNFKVQNQGSFGKNKRDKGKLTYEELRGMLWN